ncbi:Uncharacterised protein [Klebsiella pneumoniae]|nr:Uncharacterised protein [Klebsiella pneumoniae]
MEILPLTVLSALRRAGEHQRTELSCPFGLMHVG